MCVLICVSSSCCRLHPLKLECLTILRLLQLDPQYLPAVVSVLSFLFVQLVQEVNSFFFSIAQGGFPQLFTLLVEAEKDIIEISGAFFVLSPCSRIFSHILVVTAEDSDIDEDDIYEYAFFSLSFR